MCVCGGGGVGGGETLIFSYIRWPGLFLGFKSLNFNIFGGFRKLNIFLGMNILWIFFWDHHKIGLSMYRLEDIFWVAQILNIYWGA